MIRAKFIGERHDLKSSQVKRVAKQVQQAQSKQDPKHIPWSKVAQNAAFKKDRDRTGQNPPRPVVGGARSCVPMPFGFFPVFRGSSFFLHVVASFWLYNGDVSGLLSG